MNWKRLDLFLMSEISEQLGTIHKLYNDIKIYYIVRKGFIVKLKFNNNEENCFNFQYVYEVIECINSASEKEEGLYEVKIFLEGFEKKDIDWENKTFESKKLLLLSLE